MNTYTKSTKPASTTENKLIGELAQTFMRAAVNFKQDEKIMDLFYSSVPGLQEKRDMFQTRFSYYNTLVRKVKSSSDAVMVQFDAEDDAIEVLSEVSSTVLEKINRSIGQELAIREIIRHETEELDKTTSKASKN